MRTQREDDRPSRTAAAVAAGRAIGYRHLHDDLAVGLLPPAERALARRARPAAARRVGADAIAIATLGLTLHAALRMSAIDRGVARAIDAGCGQVVILGAGLDTRAWRLPSLEGAAVWEIDLPAMQQVKRRRLDVSGLDPDRAVLIGGDLASSPLSEVLAPTAHDPTRPTAWVWEAVAPYLPPKAVEATLDGIADRSAAGSHLLMTFAHPDLLGPRAMRPVTGPLAKMAFRVIREPILSTYDEQDISRLVTHHGVADPVITSSRDWLQDAELPNRPDPGTAEKLLTGQFEPV